MAYIIINSSGNRSGVTESRYNELISKDGYTGEIVGESKTSEYPIDLGGGWFELSNGKKCQGEDKAKEKQEKLNG